MKRVEIQAVWRATIIKERKSGITSAMFQKGLDASLRLQLKIVT